MELGQRQQVIAPEETTTIAPIQFVPIKGRDALPAPLVRIWTCGTLTIEVLQDVVSVDPPQGRYVTLPLPTLQGRGVGSAVALLKLLVSRPHRFASKDWLIEKLGRSSDDEEEAGNAFFGRLDNVASLLRTLLVSALRQREDLEQVRLLLLSFLRTSRESGSGYRLAEYPLIWLDTDAIAWNVERAAILDSFGDEQSLPLWERAYELVSRGAYLIDEPYSDWAQDPRQQMQGYLRQCVRVLARRYLSLFGEQGEERAILLLRTYVLAHPTEEDALRPLMELLGKRECFQEALDYYERLCKLVEEEGREPDPRTRKIGLYVQTKKLQRERAAAGPKNGSPSFVTSPSLHHPQRTTLFSPFPQGWSELLRTQPQMQRLTGNELWPDEPSLGIWFALAANYLSPVCAQGWPVDAIVEVLTIVLPVVKAMPRGGEHRFLDGHTSGSISNPPSMENTQGLQESQIRLCQSLGESIGAAWKRFHTTNIPQMLVVGEALLDLMQRNHTDLYPSVRPLLYSAVYQLIGAAHYLLGDVAQSLRALEQSYITGLQGANPWHMAQSLSWQAYVLKSLGNYTQAVEATDEALRLIAQRNDPESLRLRARLWALGAESAALLKDRAEVESRLRASEALLEHFPALHEEFDSVSWLQQAGACALELEDYHVAIQYLQQSLETLPSEWRLRYIATSLPLAKAFTRLGKIEKAITVSRNTLPVLTSVHAHLLSRQFLSYLKQDLLATSPHNSQCETLAIEAHQSLVLP